MEQIKALLRNLSANDLQEWAGARIYSRGKSYINNVDGLSRTDDGALAAWVSGSDEYATSVGLDPDGNLEEYCTCPYDDGPCKHAVAVILAAAEQVKRKQVIPLLAEDDDLYQALFGDPDEEGEDDLDDDEDDIDPQDEVEESFRAGTVVPGKGKAKIGKILGEMSKEELVAMLLDVTARHPEIERGLLDRKHLATGRIDKLVSSLRREIRNLAAEPAYYYYRSGEGSLPDYSHVQQQLESLLAAGHADAVLQLGEELWDLGNEQVEQSHDEGETGMAISECMEVVLRAIPKTSLNASEQLLWVIDRALDDGYCLLESCDKVLQRKAYTPAHWAEVAETLEGRLQSMAKPTASDVSGSYRREKVMEMLLDAYRRSGKKERIVPLLEREADQCQCYRRLVDELLAAGDRAKARQWCIAGYGQTVKSSPGIAATLQDRLREMALAEKNHDLVAAYRAQDFFDRPSGETFTELRKSAEKTKWWQAVRAAVLEYLRTGRRPDTGARGGEAWPLPAPEVARPSESVMQMRGSFPDLVVLIDIALLEKRLDDVVALYGELRKTRRYNFGTDQAVADAVAATHPQVALDIWRFLAESLIGQVKPKSYEEAAVFLRRMFKVYQANGRITEWSALLSELRREHKPKRRLMEILDGLSGKTLLD